MANRHTHGHTATVQALPTGTEGLREAIRPTLVELSDRDDFALEIATGEEADR